MFAELNALLITAASVALFHTLLGPDHYLPFIAMSWARKWSMTKTTLITFLCGIGHVASSIILGLVGVAMGLAVENLNLLESQRGNLAAWLLIAFGLAYFIWGIRRAFRKKTHAHSHFHIAYLEHEHSHEHDTEHAHVHSAKMPTNITPWALFIIFVFGPCEPLIPIVMYPAAKANMHGVFLVTVVFSFITIVTMLVVVLLAQKGINFIPMKKLQQYNHAIAGATILLCGLAIQFLGL